MKSEEPKLFLPIREERARMANWKKTLMFALLGLLFTIPYWLKPMILLWFTEKETHNLFWMGLAGYSVIAAVATLIIYALVRIVK
jgi:hypothetical protein